VRLGAGGAVESSRLFLGGVGSRPQEAREASDFLQGRRLDDPETVEEAARLAARVAKPLQNTDFAMGWRRGAAREYAARALRELAR
jgi:CO/xanthine dehydrogenase FAD-binding subunit